MNKVISVDIQPEYDNVIHFNLYEFFNYITDRSPILYLYNGAESGLSSDTKDTILKYAFESNVNLYEKDILFIDKGYGFFRGWMDNGLDENVIKEMFIYLLEHNLSDSRDVISNENDIKKIIPSANDYEYDTILKEPLFLPSMDLNVFNHFDNSELVGGAANECLAEVRIILEALDIKYDLNKKFIY